MRTPTPWTVRVHGKFVTVEKPADTPNGVVVVCSLNSQFADNYDNAAFIARAANNFDRLLAACESAVPRLTELIRYRAEREGTNFARDFDDALGVLKSAIAGVKEV